MTDRQDRKKRAHALLEGLSKSVEDLGKGLRRRRAAERRAGEEAVPAPSPIQPEPLPPTQEDPAPAPAASGNQLPPRILPEGQEQEQEREQEQEQEQDQEQEQEQEQEQVLEPPSGPTPAAAPSSPVPALLEPAASSWLTDTDLDTLIAEAPAPDALAAPSEEEALEDRLDPDFLDTVREEIDELIPAIEAALAAVAGGDGSQAPELLRLVHTLKGVAGMAGAMRTRAIIHRMESLMEEAQLEEAPVQDLLPRLSEMFARTRENLEALLSQSPRQDAPQDAPVPPPSLLQAKTVRVQAALVDRLFNEINEARLAGSSISGSNLSLRRQQREMEENVARVSRMARDLELQAEIQIQSRRAQVAESHEEFDPLEMDRFTVLQELSRLLNEAVGDVQDLHRDIVRALSDQETLLAYQERSIHEVQEGLLKTRLVSVDEAINDRLHKVALATAREMGKSVAFSLSGGRVALDRSMLEKIVSPLEHLLRNAVAHGIEEAGERQAAGKPAAGRLRVAARQEAGRVVFIVEDDGRGLDVDRIREKAVEKGLWPADRDMDERQAADMVCRPGFSTARAVTQIAGRGVGMDVVRSQVLSMGGRFDLASRPGRGLRVVIQLPTAVASASVMVVESGGEAWSVPTEIIDDVMIARGQDLVSARATGELRVQGEALPFASLATLMDVFDASSVPAASTPVLLLREGSRRVAVQVDRLDQVSEVSLRPLASLWAGVPGLVGSALLPDGRASFLVDPLRAPWQGAASATHAPTQRQAPVAGPPLVLVVDDSVTVRKVTERFLERHGFEPILAKDGVEALEILAQVTPAVMLLDVEMPRMDGFDCAKSVRENPRHRDLPIVMVSSRTAQKHRDRAFSLGVDEYLGKPFREDEMLALLQRYVRKGASSRTAPGPAQKAP